jgi:hypothetical protein
VIASALLLAGCFSAKKVSTKGACEAFPRAQYAYQGKAKEDQRFINKSIEAGVGACGFARPAPRPAHWGTHTVGNKTVLVPPAPKKKGLLDRIRGR